MRYIILRSALSFAPLCAQAQSWTLIPPTTVHTYQDIHFNAQYPDTGITCGYYFASFDIFPFGGRTTDGGYTMQPLALYYGGTFLGAYGLAFTDANTGYMCGGGMMKTFDGGQNWLQQLDVFTVGGTLYDVTFPTAMDGYAVGETWSFDGVAMITHDAGVTWDPYTVSTGMNGDNTTLTSVVRATSDRLYAGAAAMSWQSPTLFLSTDDGISWNPLNFTLGINDLWATLGDTLFAATDSGVYRIVASGTSVAPMLLTAVPVNSLDMHQGRGFAVCADGAIYGTWDHGNTWSPMPSPVPGVALNSVQVVNAQVAYAAGQAGTLIRFEDATTGIADKEDASVLEVYPNPSPDRVWLKGTAGTHYRLMDIHGGIVHSGLLSGPHTSLDLSDLPAGIYTVVTNRSAVKVAKE